MRKSKSLILILVAIIFSMFVGCSHREQSESATMLGNGMYIYQGNQYQDGVYYKDAYYYKHRKLTGGQYIDKN